MTAIHIESGSFAEACYDMNSIEELRESMSADGDAADMRNWGLTSDEYKDQIALAIAALEADSAEDTGER